MIRKRVFCIYLIYLRDLRAEVFVFRGMISGWTLVFPAQSHAESQGIPAQARFQEDARAGAQGRLQQERTAVPHPQA